MRPGPAAPLPLEPDIMARWGIHHDAARGMLSLAPRPVPGEARATCPPFRAGRTVVALELRQRPGTTVLRIAVRFGPAIRVAVTLPGPPGSPAATVDEVPMAGPRVAFEARGTHEVAWMA